MRLDDNETWLRGCGWRAVGDYERAFVAWSSVTRVPVLARVHVSRASSLRELGLHVSAERDDEAGLRLGVQGAAAAALHIGRVADAVGLGDTALAVARLGDAEKAVATLAPGREERRQRRRLGWVRVEVALLVGAGRADVALPVRHPAGRLVVPPLYHDAGRHHLAKGLLFSGVLHRDRRALDEAASMAAPRLAWAVELARADAGATDALAAARAAWRRIRPPAAFAAEVAATPTARRLGGAGPTMPSD